MEFKETIPPAAVGSYVSPDEAAKAIAVLSQVLLRLEGRPRNDRLQACIGFAQDALWTAAFPNDPFTLLDLIADQAQNAMG